MGNSLNEFPKKPKVFLNFWILNLDEFRTKTCLSPWIKSLKFRLWIASKSFSWTAGLLIKKKSFPNFGVFWIQDLNLQRPTGLTNTLSLSLPFQEFTVLFFDKRTAERPHKKKRKELVVEVLRKGYANLFQVQHNCPFTPANQNNIRTQNTAITSKFLQIVHKLEGKLRDRRADREARFEFELTPLSSLHNAETNDTLAFAVEPLFGSLANITGEKNLINFCFFHNDRAAIFSLGAIYSLHFVWPKQRIVMKHYDDSFYQNLFANVFSFAFSTILSLCVALLPWWPNFNDGASIIRLHTNNPVAASNTGHTGYLQHRVRQNIPATLREYSFLEFEVKYGLMQVGAPNGPAVGSTVYPSRWSDSDYKTT